MSTNEIRKKFSISPNKLYAILKTYKIPLHGNRLLPDTVNKLIEFYKETNNLNKCCIVLGISKSCASKWLKRSGIDIKPGGQFAKKYTVNESFFFRPSTHQKKLKYSG